ncbi:Protein Networked (NET), actin-binding (NAB) domain [Dillenia turbinata]|uniref:Protein Networked (NET), actin-binding (NAB) domain n=1 Tax=Dillenia turbinata TaxID=194707 RepID=A0AAN8W2V6_9MAGN
MLYYGNKMTDMDEKVYYILKVIDDDDGDSFAKRAEMYYKKRPELINFLTMDDDDEEKLSKAFVPAGKLEKKVADMLQKNPSIPNAPKIPAREFRAPSTFLMKKGQLKRMSSSAAHVPISSSVLSKTEALEEMDKHQKGILVLQKEEFVKSTYGTAYAKYWEIEKQITEMQQKVCGLQDESGIGTGIEDDEAQSLMASTALKSCQEALDGLQEKQKKSAEEKVELQRISEKPTTSLLLWKMSLGSSTQMNKKTKRRIQLWSLQAQSNKSRVEKKKKKNNFGSL